MSDKSGRWSERIEDAANWANDNMLIQNVADKVDRSRKNSFQPVFSFGGGDAENI